MFKQDKAIHSPKPQISQYGALVAGDIDNDGRIDALVLGCCGRTFMVSEDGQSIPNFSWVWFNQKNEDGWIVGEVASLEALEGRSVSEAALADLDGDQDLDLFAVPLPATAAVPGSAIPAQAIPWRAGWCY